MEKEELKENIQEEKNRTHINVKWQEKCDLKIKNQTTVLLSSPTGSGKTGRYMKWGLEKEERPIYITAPIKALSNQRWRELKEQGYVVGLETGDIKYIPEGCEIICCTQEIYNNKYCKEESATLIMDEFHYIFENPDRARAYIDSLFYSRAKNTFICSATLGNIDEIKDYLNEVTQKEFFVYDNKERLTELQYNGYIEKEKIQDSLVVAFSQNKCRSIADDIYYSRVDDEEREQPSEEKIEDIREIAKKYLIDDAVLKEIVEEGVAYYFGAMLPKEKLFVEELFEKRLIDTVVGTDALALGVNFPVENVVFTQLAKYVDGNVIEVSKNLFEQLAGRAGRKGYFDMGNVYFCDDFVDDRGEPIEVEGYETEDIFYKLLNAKNESVTISLSPNIKSILSGESSPEIEADFMVRYSTGKKDKEAEIRKIQEKIDYIENYDVIKSVICEEIFYQYDESRYDDLFKKYGREHIGKIRKRTDELLNKGIQQEFFENISRAYMEEYSARDNCHLFVDILLGRSLNELIKKYGKEFYDILQLRKYICALPPEYRSNIDIVELERTIDKIDHTALHIGENTVSILEINDTLNEERGNNGAMAEMLKKLGLIDENDKGIIENQDSVDTGEPR